MIMSSINNILPLQITAGVSGQYIHGEGLTMGIVNIEAGGVVPLHQHPHEQITFILEGELHMVIGEIRVLLKQGDYHVIPSNTLHSAKAEQACKVMDVFTPVRDDYRKGVKMQ
jgi:quercetin dioxygenase-like cupin family protein